MGFFDEANDDAMSVSPDKAATGKRVGFLESFEVGWNAQVRASAVYGIENEMSKVNDEQTNALRRAGVEDIPQLLGFLPKGGPLNFGPASNAYLDVAKFYTDGGDPAFATQMQEYDKRVDALKEKYPDLNLRNSREMYDEVRGKAQMYEERANNDRRTTGGSIGGFLGGAVASFNPNSDPLNVVTAPIGGAGKSVLTRIAGQGIAQGFVEGLNQITGVQEQRRLLGLDYGVGDAIMRVGGAVVGGAAIQGIGEGVAFGARRFFRGAAREGAPMPDRIERDPVADTSMVPPQAIPRDENLAAAKLTNDPRSFDDYMHQASPLSNSRAGRARTVLDADYMTQKLEEWDSGNPASIFPKSDTAPALGNSDFVAPDITRFVERAQIDDMARGVDPDTFRKYDDLLNRKQTYKRWIDELGVKLDSDLQAPIDRIDLKISELAQKAEETGGKRAAKIRKDIAALEAQKVEVVQAASSFNKETTEVSRVRMDMLRTEQKMYDLAPLVSRAYARAQGKWDNTAADRKAIYDAMREARRDIAMADPQAVRIADAVEAQLLDKAPILRDRPRVEAGLKKDADAADVAQAIVADNVKIIEEAVEQYRSSLDGLIALEKGDEIEIQGQSYKLNLDKDTVIVPNEDGTGGREISIRQLLEENKATEHELEAVQSCSLRKTS